MKRSEEFKRAEELRKAQERAASEATSAVNPFVSVLSPSVSAASRTSSVVPAQRKSGFDVGLILAFPVIVATLAFFFFFPFIGETLSKTFPVN